jgi:acetyl esterase/lipase/lysophospholipase L1-like esterase
MCVIIGTGSISTSFCATSIACVGNSITAGYGLSDATKSYPSLLLKMLGTTYLAKSIVNVSSPVTLANQGVSSRTLLKKGNLPYWNETAFSQIFTIKPAIITIMLGTNDTKPINWDTHSTEFEGDYKAMVDTFSTITPKPKIILCIPPPIFTNTFTISDSVMVNGIMPKVLATAQAKGLSIIDARTALLTKQSCFAKDGVHPDTLGAKMIADIFYEGILNYTTTQLYKIRFLWYGNAPGMIGAGTDTTAKPFLHIYPVADSINTHAAVVICPGGGYTHLAIQKEGDSVAMWFAKKGVTAFVLRYRYNPYLYPNPMNDAKRAIRTVRYLASTYGIDTSKIGIMGFSAGGHVASTVATHYDNGNSASLDPIEKNKCKPDFNVLIYPVITMTGIYTHTGSRDNLLGTSPAPSAALLDSLSNQKWVTPQTSKTFLAHGSADVTVPIQNSTMFDSACAANNVPHKFIVDPGKVHGFGLAGVWPDSLYAWMKSQGIISSTKITSSPRSNNSLHESLVSMTVSANRLLHISFTTQSPHSVSIYSLAGKRVADLGKTITHDCEWHPCAPGVYLVHIAWDNYNVVKTVNITF